jgi:HK97 family phage major capsid protein
MLGGQAYDLGLDNVIVSGVGSYQPTGITTNAGAAGVYCPIVNCGNPVSVPGLINLVEGMPPQYADSPTTVAVMNKINAWAQFAQLEDSSGQLIFGLARTDGPEGLASPRVHKLLGYPVIFSPFWQNTGAAAYPLGFGDPKATYIFAQRVGMTVETYGTQDRSMIQKNQLGWNFRFRCGGQVVQNRAFHVGAQS